MGRGLFITFEGPEGAGKTVQAELLRKAFLNLVIVVREPGGTTVGEKIRQMLLFAEFDLDPETEMYLFMAARRQLVAEVIVPELMTGRIVVADRYHDSTLAYQGGGRGVATSWPASFPRPDITFLLSVSVAGGRERQIKAGKRPDRVERESIEFHERVAAEYERLAAADPTRFVRIDAAQSPNTVHSLVMDRVLPLVERLR